MLKKEIIWPLLISILTLVLGQGLFYKLYYSPDLTYETLPIHTIGDQETLSIVIKNKSKVLLHNVLITINSEQPIYKMRIEGPEIMDTGGTTYLKSGQLGENKIQMKLERLVRESNYTFTILTKKDSKADITIVSDEIAAKKELPEKGAGFLSYLLLILSAMGTGLATLGIIKLKRLVSSKDCLDQRKKSGKRLKEILDRCSGMLTNAISLLIEAKKGNDINNMTKLIQASEELIKGVNEILKEYANTINIEGICYDSKKNNIINKGDDSN